MIVIPFGTGDLKRCFQQQPLGYQQIASIKINIAKYNTQDDEHLRFIDVLDENTESSISM